MTQFREDQWVMLTGKPGRDQIIKLVNVDDTRASYFCPLTYKFVSVPVEELRPLPEKEAMFYWLLETISGNSAPVAARIIYENLVGELAL